MKLLLAALLAITPFLSGCQVTYLMKNGYYQMRLLNKRQPIEKVLADAAVSEDIKRKLRLALEAIEFAEKKLGLKDSGNYRTFVQLEKPYITWIVRASPEYKLEHYTWWFPIIGSVPYKGYFNEEGAKSEAADFDELKWDTSVRGVTAYSTLGWFHDPLLSSMMSYEDYDLVNVIIHETVHATLFIKDEADFNERLATFLGDYGTELFYQQKEGATSATVEKIRKDNVDSKVFSEWISKHIDDLKKWYKDGEGKITPEMKQARLDEIKKSFVEDLKPRLKEKSFSYFEKQKLNNAVLLNYLTYYYDLSDFEKLRDKLGPDFSALLQYCKNLEKSDDPENDLKEFVRK